MEKQKSGSGTAYGNVSGSVCVLEWGSSDRWSADFVRLCDFLGWKSGLRCHGEISVLDERSFFPWAGTNGMVYEKTGESNPCEFPVSGDFCFCASDDTGY